MIELQLKTFHAFVTEVDTRLPVYLTVTRSKQNEPGRRMTIHLSTGLSDKLTRPVHIVSLEQSFADLFTVWGDPLDCEAKVKIEAIEGNAIVLIYNILTSLGYKVRSGLWVSDCPRRVAGKFDCLRWSDDGTMVEISPEWTEHGPVYRKVAETLKG